jgi:hypothetical protein
MREIKASTKVHGTRRNASVEAARRRVRDGELYLIRRHGGFFRPGAHGYTIHLAAAGLFDAKVARSYLSVDGLSVVPVGSVVKRAQIELSEAEAIAAGLRDFLAIADRKQPKTSSKKLIHIANIQMPSVKEIEQIRAALERAQAARGDGCTDHVEADCDTLRTIRMVLRNPDAETSEAEIERRYAEDVAAGRPSMHVPARLIPPRWPITERWDEESSNG